MALKEVTPNQKEPYQIPLADWMLTDEILLSQAL
jgi:hypothetical protein